MIAYLRLAAVYLAAGGSVVGWWMLLDWLFRRASTQPDEHHE